MYMPTSERVRCSCSCDADVMSLQFPAQAQPNPTLTSRHRHLIKGQNPHTFLTLKRVILAPKV